MVNNLMMQLDGSTSGPTGSGSSSCGSAHVGSSGPSGGQGGGHGSHRHIQNGATHAPSGGTSAGGVGHLPISTNTGTHHQHTTKAPQHLSRPNTASGVGNATGAQRVASPVANSAGGTNKGAGYGSSSNGNDNYNHGYNISTGTGQTQGGSTSNIQGPSNDLSAVGLNNANNSNIGHLNNIPQTAIVEAAPIPPDGIVFAHLRNIPNSLVVYRSRAARDANPERLNLDRRKLVQCPILESEERIRLLNYQNNKIKTIGNLDNLRNLIFLDLYNNHITSLNSDLSGCHTLRVLMLGKNRIGEISNLSKLTKLDVLDLHSNYIKKMDKLESLTELRVLNLAGNHITTVENIEGLQSLTELNLRRNKITNVYELHLLPALQRVFLSNNKLSSLDDTSCLFKVKFLMELALDGNPLVETVENNDSRAGDILISGGSGDNVEVPTNNSANGTAGSDALSVPPNTLYRSHLIDAIPTLRHFDLKRISDSERVSAASFSRRIAEKKKIKSRMLKGENERKEAIHRAERAWTMKTQHGPGVGVRDTAASGVRGHLHDDSHGNGNGSGLSYQTMSDNCNGGNKREARNSSAVNLSLADRDKRGSSAVATCNLDNGDIILKSYNGGGLDGDGDDDGDDGAGDNASAFAASAGDGQDETGYRREGINTQSGGSWNLEELLGREDGGRSNSGEEQTTGDGTSNPSRSNWLYDK